jgi:hypothetical protein
MAPETLRGRSTPAADVYGVGLLMYELFTGGGPHLDAPWPRQADEENADVCYRIKEGLRFAPPSASQNEIRFDYRWLDDLILRCLETNPARRFRDAGQLLAAIQTCEAGGPLPQIEETPSPEAAAEPKTPFPGSPTGSPATTRTALLPGGGSNKGDALLREARRLLANREFAQVIDRLDVHRPAEWVVIDVHGARVLRLLSQAYLGRSDWKAARDCLEQLRAVQKEQSLLPRQEYAAALSDLIKCYRRLGLVELAEACQREAREL